MMDTETVSLEFTETAALKVKELIACEKKPNLRLRLYIRGGGCSGFRYGFTLDDEINQDDKIFEKQGVKLIIDPMSFQYLIGSKIDYIEELEGSRFFVVNPNAKGICGCGYSFSI